QMEGIDSVTIKGYNDHQYEVQLDYDSMVENQLDPNSIRSEIESSLNPVILGQETDNEETIRMSFQDETPIEVLEQVRVGEENIPLTDVADVELVEDRPEDIVEHEGERAVSFTVFLAGNQDVPSVSKDVESLVNTGFEQLPENINID